jgi:hypothetical protein
MSAPCLKDWRDRGLTMLTLSTDGGLLSAHAFLSQL